MNLLSHVTRLLLAMIPNQRRYEGILSEDTLAYRMDPRTLTSTDLSYLPQNVPD